MQNLELNDDNVVFVQDKIGEKSIGYYILKRIIDLIGSFCGIILLSPFMLLIAVAIRIDSKGSIIFGHERLGYKGKHIKVYKFRTMIENAEGVLKKLTPEQKREYKENFKLEHDPRITKVGDFLRRTSLDELPQLLNIFIGNMTIVGSRPIVQKELPKYGKYGKKFLSVKPGLTGLWQTSGRSDTSYEERVALDMKYIDNRGIWSDIKIILKTFVVVIKKDGAR
ncbi:MULTISPECIES: sugar transferase [Clostridium]|uniref:sugar transferase n=1 Tax=Clostridium TaxID=1485 RepID=UPI000824A3C6|nr:MULTISPECIES: sugar transferase [Clostridium]PJI08932.1 sugar transferase [Clostridium sp. CT7]